MNNSSLFSSSFEAIIIGSGAAGLYASLCLPSQYRVAIVTKAKLKTGASQWAQGGIAAAISAEDSTKLHLEDTLKAGAGLCDRPAVEFLVNNAPSAIASLVEMGVAFDRKVVPTEQKSELALTLEAAHSRPRVLHAADTTGKAIVTTLTEQVEKRENIEIFPQAFALSLWLQPQTNKCQGVSILYQGKIIWLKADAVILATGGGGQVFAHTTNPPVSTGDGAALAARVGAKLRDLEFFQFHPTALNMPNVPRFLISEAVRGEGAYLVDQAGKRFVFNYHPQGELAPRDVVSRAIYDHLQKTGQDRVYLDLSPIPPAKISRRFPNIITMCQRWGIDVYSQPIPVSPAAHYWMGGISVDRQNQTSIPGLYAIGETASTGVHGANRLASNSLLECIVYAGQLKNLKLNKPIFTAEKEAILVNDSAWESDINFIKKIRHDLPNLVWQSVGIVRHAQEMESALAQIKAWRDHLFCSSLSQYIVKLVPQVEIEFTQSGMDEDIRLAAETLNLLDISLMILQGAIFRQESRGGHYRRDFPQTSPDWLVHTIQKGVDLPLTTEPVRD